MNRFVKKILVLLSVILLCVFCKKNEGNTNYIAHACSAIDGIMYTNSMEALNQAIDFGIKYIEIDLQMTSDSVLVGVHDWEQFHTYIDDKKHGVMTFEDFEKSRIYGKYTPISYKDILDIWSKHSDLFLVTDKISSPKILNKFLGQLKDRTMVECFSMNDYNDLKKSGWTVFYSGKITKELVKRNVKHLRLRQLPPIFADNYVVCGCELDYKTLIGKSFAVFDICEGIVTKAMADSIFKIDNRIKFVYVDEFNDK